MSSKTKGRIVRDRLHDHAVLLLRLGKIRSKKILDQMIDPVHNSSWWQMVLGILVVVGVFSFIGLMSILLAKIFLQ